VLTGQLNVFQRLARTWDAVHPYNAAQACRVAGSFAPNALNDAWNDTLKAFSFQPARERVGIVRDDLSIHFTTEINRRFDDPRQPPFRAFAQAGDDSTWLVIVYQHWVADSVSVRLLMREWLARLMGAPTRQPVRKCGKIAADANFLALLRRYADYRRARKVQTLGPLDYPTRVRLVDSTGPIIPGLLAYARSRDATVNDLFVAALAEACDRLVPAESRRGRPNLAVSSVVDLRRSRRRDIGFGCLLGFNSTVCSRFELANWDRLLRAVAHRRGTRDSAGVLWMLAAEVASRFTPPDRVYDFYRKEAPFAGGISNVNLNGTWFAKQLGKTVLDYLRVSPAGPMVPLAMNVTTLGEGLRLSMTYRSALLNDWVAKELGEMFFERLRRISCGSV
jgi:NRPS condensation-like uncharacterized protein